MKSISASIIVLAATTLLLGGCFVAHGDSGLFVKAGGCAVGAAGMWGWFVSIKETNAA